VSSVRPEQAQIVREYRQGPIEEEDGEGRFSLRTKGGVLVVSNAWLVRKGGRVSS